MRNTPDTADPSADWHPWLPDGAELRAHWGRDCLYTQSVLSVPLLGLRDVCGLLCDERTAPERVGVCTVGRGAVEAEESVRPGPGETDLERIKGLLADGAGLTLGGVEEHHPEIRRICQRMRRRFGRPVEATASLSPSGREVLPLQRNRADTIVVQASGAKHWQILEHLPGQDGLGPVTRPEAMVPQYLLTLTPGDTCYIPAGWYYRTRSADVWSLHVSITVSPAGRPGAPDTIPPSGRSGTAGEAPRIGHRARALYDELTEILGADPRPAGAGQRYRPVPRSGASLATACTSRSRRMT
ncbi:JmjC domain-containing protein [Nocardiopsis sp. LOL_012]|uniref:JmjC domain-containing protein n=1 Tax=Nocardiopsis sp. LOL_012 TaxID=3345409 RepID=UPI003A8C5092